MKYLRKSSGTYKYRRRVPEHLVSTLGKTEFVKVLGKTEHEAMQNYGPCHARIQRIIDTTSPKSDAADIAAISSSIEGQFTELQIDPYSVGWTVDERLAREEEADSILQKYPLNPETGHPSPGALSAQDDAMVQALLAGINGIRFDLTISQAFEFYLAEKKEPDPYKRKKQLQRFERAKNALLHVTGQDIPISKVSRVHARRVRDDYLTRMSTAAAKRNLNDLKSVFSYVIREHDLTQRNPFSELELPKPEDAAINLRHSLPRNIIGEMYRQLDGSQTLLDVWTLLHHTGAQSAEILGLQGNDVKIDEEIPHIEIKPYGLRSVKDTSRIRKVPLIGRAYDVVARRAESVTDGEFLFPEYGPTEKHDNFSQKARYRLSKVTDNPKHTVYSLRHSMKDALRDADVGYRIENPLLGHTNGKSSSFQYESAPRLEELYEAMKRVDFDVQ